MSGVSGPNQLEMFRSLVDQTSALVYVVDAESAMVVDVSEAAWRVAGGTRDDWVGKSARLLRTSYPLQTENDWQAFVARASEPDGFWVNLEIGKAGGTTFPADLHMTVREFGDRRYVVATGRALESSGRVYADLERQNFWQAALLELATHPAVMLGDLDQAGQLLAEKAAEAMPCAGAAVWLRDTAVPDLLLAKGVAGELSIPIDASINLTYFPDVLAMLNAGRATDLFSSPGTRLELLATIGALACLAAPIRIRGEISGVVTLFHNSPRAWSLEDVTFAGMLADQAAAALLSAEYRHAQSIIRESEERYRNFIQNAGEGIWRIEFPEPIGLDLPVDEQLQALLSTGVVAECNDALARMGGFECAENVVGRPLSALLPIRDERARESVRALVRAGYFVQNLSAVHLDQQGREHWVLRNVEGVIEDGRLVRLWGSSRDVTQRKRAEDLVYNLAQARSQSDFFRSLASHLAQSLGATEVAVIEYPPEGGAPEVLARVVNGEFVTQIPKWLVDGDTEAVQEQRAVKPLVDSRGYRSGLLVALFPQAIEGRPMVDSALGAFAARAAAELERTGYHEELERSEQRYRSFVEYSSESIWRFDLREPLPLSLPEDEQVEHLRLNSYLAECNQASAQHLGVDSPAQLMGMTLFTLFPAHVPERIRELLEIVRSGYRLNDQETWHVMPDGARRWYSRSVMGIRHDETIIRLWGVSRDITAQKAMEQQIRALSARRQDVLEEERARISREIHDDLGQQLSGLKMYIGSVARKEPMACAEALKLIDAAIDSTRRIAVNLRPPVLDHFGLAAAIEGHARDLARTSGLVLDCDVQENVVVAPGQALAIFRILQESLNNVLRHAWATEVMVTLIEEEADLVLRVSDNGRGLPGNSPVGGLGLVGMRERASAYGGELTMASKPGRGTAVEARFPISKQPTRRASA